MPHAAASFRKATALFRSAAEQGDTAAERNLNNLLEEDGARSPSD
ncbi:hypothetical protein [Roseibium sediminicola]|nr:hypothetical protein [Roseibium sp. CAU 1639]